MNMPFGRHRGTPLDQLPEDYLTWLSTLGDLREPLRTAVKREVEDRRWSRRYQQQQEQRYAQDERGARDVDRGAALDLVRAGYRQTHPDHGGDLERMKSINVAAQWLRNTIGRALGE